MTTPPAGATITIRDERAITIPNSVLSVQETRRITDFLDKCAEDGYVFRSAAAQTRDFGSQRDPDVRVTSVVLTLVKKP